MKLLSILFSALLLTVTMTSCSDFLTEKPKGKLTPDNYFTSQEELDMAVYALYSKVCATQASSYPMLIAWQGDDITTNPGSNKQNFADIDAFHPSDGNNGAVWAWRTSYVVIKVANDIINRAGKTPTTEEEKNIAIGQARYWRAVNYFFLVKRFGSVPMNLVGDIDYNRPLASVEEVYAQIVADLNACITMLPTKYTDEPRFISGANIYVTKQAAQATLAAVDMAMAGWPLQKAERYADAAALTKAIIDGVQAGTYEYILESDFKNVYAPSHNYTNETVVGINFSGTFKWDEDSELSKSNLFESLGGWGDGWGELLFWKDFPSGPRKDAIYNPKILKNNGRKGETELLDWWEVEERHPMFSIFTVGPDNVDYDYTKPAGYVSSNSHRHRLIRYSEVLLWYAEAQCRAEGAPNTLAYQCINRVRQRAGLSPLPAGMNASDFIEACIQEHGWEVAGYIPALVTRRDDLMRLNRLEQVFYQRKQNTPITVVPNVTLKETLLIPDNVTWQGEKTIYLPYPALDKQLNRQLKR
ncbi:RagB/SusD family nutrient uptake outer membrane protein [Segatella maculosa]|uniref:RagB/SusD family nutrient uptake outer membrane protein n=1 Tax=Segatella maculosa TaxID=439703 RepID=UPI00046F5C0B|nr:RagB/SusD family nutrient uptake outer membrane protein [Segatella maculosa]